MQLNLTKEGGNKFSLNLDKGAKFNISGRWNSSRDVDLHVLVCNGESKVTSLDDVVSTYNDQAMFNTQTGQPHPRGGKSPFGPKSKCVIHNGDARNGLAIPGTAPDEVITIDTSALPAYAERIFIIATIHEANGATFADVQDLNFQVSKEDNGILFTANASQNFAADNVVQFGSFVKTPTGWDFDPKCLGVSDPTADLNTVLALFS